MGKITAKDAEALQQSGLLSDTAIAEMQNKGFVSKDRIVVRRFFKTAEGQWVEPRLYFRGGKDTTRSKKMESFLSEYNILLEKYTTTRNNNKK